MYQQLKQPQLNTIGQVGACLSYARRFYGVGPKYQWASEAWQHTDYKHLDRTFPDADILLWFSYVLNGKDEGHVAPRLRDGRIFSSPWKQGTTHAVFNDIDELIRIYSDNGKHPMKYLGWSEDINGVRVAKPANQSKMIDMLNKGDIVNMYQRELGHAPSAQTIKDWLGKSGLDLWYRITASKEWRARQKFLAMAAQQNGDLTKFQAIKKIVLG